MSFFFSSEHVIYHSHIPRTAGASVREWLNKESLPVRGFSGYKSPCALQHRHLGDKSLAEDFKHYDPDVFFAVIRHPVERLKSFWKMKYGNEEFVNPTSDFHLFVVNAIELQNRESYHENNALRQQVEFVDDRFELFAQEEVAHIQFWLQSVLKMSLRKFPDDKHNRTAFDFTVKGETREIIESHYRADLELHTLLKYA